MGGYERDPVPWSPDGIPPTSTASCSRRIGPIEPLLENAIRRVPALEEMEVVRLINGPEAFTPDGEFVLSPTDVRGFWVAAGFCAHGLAGAGGMGSSSPSGSAEGRRSLDVRQLHGLPPLRCRPHEPGLHARAYDRGLLDLLRRHVPRAGAGGGLAAEALPNGLKYPQGLGAAFGEKSGWERGELVDERRPPATSLRPRGWAWDATGRRSARSTGRAARRRRSTSPRSRRSRSLGRALPSCPSGSATTASPETSARSPTRRC